MLSILSAIVLIGVLVLVHEFGHFVVARRFNIKVLKFSIGFGPKIYSFKRGETEYLISSVPLGGYVKMHGEDEDEVTEDRERAFNNQTPLRKMLVVFSGPFFNFVFAWVVFVLVSMIGYKTLSTKVGDVKPDYPAYTAGLAKGDYIRGINGREVRSWEEISSLIKKAENNTLEIEYERAGKPLKSSLAPKMEQGRNIFGEEAEVPVIGIVSSDEFVRISYPVHKAFLRGSQQVYDLTKLTVMTIYKLFKRTVPVSSLGGPIMITKLAGETAKTGFLSFVMFTAFLSINLGVLNLVPIPILDGGHIVIFAYEGITGKKVSPRFREVFMYVGLTLIGLLTVTVFYNDIIRVFLTK